MEASSEQLLIDLADDDSHLDVSAQDDLQSLKEVTDRVSQQVEEFARRMHQFQKQRRPDDQALWEESMDLLNRFSAIAERRAAQIPPRRAPSRPGSGSYDDSEAEKEKVEFERQLWVLLGNVLLCNSPKAQSEATDAQADRLAQLHRYSPSTEIWNTFLDCDLTAQEYETTLSWLQQRAAESPTSIDKIIANLTAQSGRGDGIWSAGPLFTKNIIKKQKRNRALDTPLDPPASDRGNNNTATVTQLDPDAQSRQDAALDEQDEMHERAAWLTCWQMIRRGIPFDEVRAWWTKRNEQWRACVLRACDGSSTDANDSTFRYIINITSNAEWALRCRTLAQSATFTDPYQCGVVGLLSGDLAATSEACEDIDDSLYAIFNAKLVQRYNDFIAAYRKKLLDNNTDPYQSSPSDRNEIVEYIQSLQADFERKAELQAPHKYIELAIAGEDFTPFFLELGTATAELAQTDEDLARLVQVEDTSASSEGAVVTICDEDSVRIVVHMQLVLKELGFLDQAYSQNQYLMENNIANYIACLQRTHKWGAVALYASALSKERTQTVLGSVYIEITDDNERKHQVVLMKAYGIDVPDVLYGIAALENFTNIQKFEEPSFAFNAPSFVFRPSGVASQTKIKNGFMDNEFLEADDRAISSVEWYQFIDAANWGKACFHISLLYKLWLYEGNFSALIQLKNRASLSAISRSGTGMNLSFAEQELESPQEENGDIPMNDDEDGPRFTQSPTRRRKEPKVHPLAHSRSTREALYDQSVVWLHLEQLVEMLESFEEWQDVADATEE